MTTNTSVKKILQFPLVRMIAGFAFCLGSVILIKKFIAQPILYKLFSDKTVADTIKNLISFSVLLISYFLFEKYYERRKATEISTTHFTKELFIGAILGFFTISLAIFILFLLGYYQIITMSTANYSLKLFTLLLTAALVEDLLHRGLIVRILENWLGTYITLIIAMLFETQHLFNPNANLISGIMDLFWGFTMAMLYVYTKRIWLPFFFHVGWNFAQPFYGSNLTGSDDMGTIIQSKFEGPVLLTGGKIGIEGSIITIFFLMAIGVILLYKARKENKIVPHKSERRFL